MYIRLALSCCLHPDSPINILIDIENMFHLWFVFHAELDSSKNKFTYTRNIILSLYAFVVEFIMFVICGLHIPPPSVLHVLNIVFICHIAVVSPILFLSREIYKMPYLRNRSTDFHKICCKILVSPTLFF